METQRTLCVPVGLCEFVARNNLYNAFQLFIYLKINSCSCTRISCHDLKIISKDLGIKSIKTVKSNLQKLRNLNWIGYNIETGYYFVRGFKKVLQLQRIESGLVADFDVRNILGLRAFIAGVLICNLIYKQKYRHIREERKFGRSLHNRRIDISCYYPIACNALVKYYGLSIGTAFNMKKAAQNAGYIKIKHDYQRLYIPLEELNQYKKSIPEERDKLFVKNGKVYMRFPDLVCPVINIHRRKKLEL